MEKQPRVKVIPIKTNWRKEPGDVCKYASKYGIKVEHCSNWHQLEGENWEGYIYSHPALGESKDAYESAEECADAGMKALATDLAQDVGMMVVRRQMLHGVRQVLTGARVVSVGVLKAEIDAVLKTLNEILE